MNKLKQLFSTKKGRWQLAIGITLLFYIFVFLTLDINFATNDDTRIMYALAGYASGEPYPEQAFINYFLGLPISLLYSALPFVPWYAIYHISAMLISEVVIFYCFYKVAYQKQLSLLIPLFMQIFSLVLIFILPLVSIQFTLTSTITGTSAVVLMATKQYSDKWKTKCAIYTYCFIALLFSFMTRSLSWYCIMCFFILSCVYQIAILYYNYPDISKQRKRRYVLKIIVFILVLTSGCFLIRFVSRGIKNSSEITQVYNEYNDYRVDFMDYNQRLPYEGNEQLYSKINWDNDVYRAMLCLLFLDEHINGESLNVITDAYKGESSNSIYTAYMNLKTVFENYHFVRLSFIGILSLFIYLFHIAFKEPKYRIFLSAGFCSCLGCSILLIYLAYSGRLPLRSWQSVVIPCFSFMILMILNSQDKHTKNYYQFYGIIAMVLGICSLHMLYIDKDYAVTQTSTEATYEQFKAFEEYAVDRQEDFFVYDFTVATINRNPFVVYPDKKPINTMVSGGSYTFSELYYDQLAANKLNSLFWKDLIKSNIYFVSANSDFVELTKRNIEREVKNAINVKTIKRFGDDDRGITVYKFIMY